MHIDSIIVAAYLGLLIWMGLRGGQDMQTAASFSAGGKTYGAPVIFMSLAASYVGGGFSAGNAAYAFSGGIGMTVALLGFSVVTVLVGRYLVPGIKRFDGVTTTGEIIRYAYGKNAGILIGIVAFFTCAAVVGAQMEAMGSVLHALLGIPPAAGVLLGCGIVLVYSTVGGLQSVIAADIVQFVLLCIGMPILLFSSLHAAGGIGNVLAATPTSFFDPLNGRSLASFLSFTFTVALGETLVPPYTQRLLIGKNLRATARGTVAGGVFSAPFFVITGLIGLTAHALQVTTVPADAMPSLILTVLPIGVRGVIMAAMVSIMLSAADGFLNGAAVSAVQDVVVPLFPKLSDKRQLLLLRAVNLLTGVAAVSFALLIPDVFTILEISYTFWCPLAVVPLGAALLGVKTTPRAFFCGITAAFLVTLVWEYILARPFDIAGAPLGLLANLLVFCMCRPRRALLKIGVADSKEVC